MFGKRLKQLREERNLRQEDLGKIVNVEKSTVSQWESGKRTPDVGTILALADYFGVSTDFLLGKTPVETKTSREIELSKWDNIFGQRLKKLREEAGYTQQQLAKLVSLSQQTIGHYEVGRAKPDADTLEMFADIFGTTVDYLLGRTEIRNFKPMHVGTTTRIIPILGQIKMGVPVLAEENYIGELEIPSDIKADFALECKGDSMIGVGLLDGDYALCRYQETAYSGDIVVALRDIAAGYMEATLKYYFRENDTSVLRSANPEYPDIPLNDEYRIVGVLVAIIRKEAPTYRLYTEYITTRDANKEKWDPVIEKAFQMGIRPEQVLSVLEMIYQAGRRM